MKYPYLTTVSDYHEFREVEQDKRRGRSDIRVREVGYIEPDYVGVVYLYGNKPSKKEIRQMVNRKFGKDLE